MEEERIGRVVVADMDAGSDFTWDCGGDARSWFSCSAASNFDNGSIHRHICTDRIGMGPEMVAGNFFSILSFRFLRSPWDISAAYYIPFAVNGVPIG